MNTSSSDAGTTRPPCTDRPRSATRARDELHGITGRSGPEPHVHALAEDVDVDDVGQRRQDRDDASLIGRDDFHHRPGQLPAQIVRRVEGDDFAFVQQRDPVAALGFVQVRRADENRDALLQELREELPELAARHRIDAGRRLVEQDHARLVDQRARERELLLHASRQPVREPGPELHELRQLEQPRAASSYFERPWISAKNAMFSSMLRSP